MKTELKTETLIFKCKLCGKTFKTKWDELLSLKMDRTVRGKVVTETFNHVHICEDVVDDNDKITERVIGKAEMVGVVQTCSE